MQPSFSFAVEPLRRLVRITMAGFFRPGDVAQFRAELDLAHKRLGAPPNQHLTLIDVRDMKVQSQDAVADFRAIFTEPRYRSERLAIVTSSSLSRSQVKRAAEGRGAAYFETVVDAEAWLLCEIGSAQAA